MEIKISSYGVVTIDCMFVPALFGRIHLDDHTENVSILIGGPTNRYLDRDKATGTAFSILKNLKQAEVITVTTPR